MFVLRKINEERVELNFIIGNDYTLFDKKTSPEEFERQKERFNLDDCIFAVIYGLDKNRPLLISKSHQNYIMLDGKTIDVLTEKH